MHANGGAGNVKAGKRKGMRPLPLRKSSASTSFFILKRKGGGVLFEFDRGITDEDKSCEAIWGFGGLVSCLEPM